MPLLATRVYMSLRTDFFESFVLARFMWTFKHSRDIYWVLLLPLNVLPAVLTDLFAIRLLSALCIAAGCLQLFLSDRIRKHGLQFV